MTKQEFITALQSKLSGLPKENIEESLNFYSEMIDDRIEEGCTEEEAVSAVGSVDDISAQIIADIPLAKLAKERIKPKKRLAAWEIVLLVLGAPLWIPLLVAAISVILSLYAVIWSLIVSLWAVFGSFCACVVGGIVAGIVFLTTGNTVSGIAVIGAAICLAGLSIFMFFACKAATRDTAELTKKIALKIKKCFIRKEAA